MTLQTEQPQDEVRAAYAAQGWRLTGVVKARARTDVWLRFVCVGVTR